MKYKLIVFDMDGTLADTSLGIRNSHRYAHKMMGYPEPTDEVLNSLIGAPLLQTYREQFLLSEEEARRAIVYYRNYYREHGMYEAMLYPGMPDVLENLIYAGSALGVASLKAESFLIDMLEHMKVRQRFSVIYGMDEQDSRTKAQLVKLCMQKIGVSSEQTLLIGDSEHDLQGAKACGVDFFGVTYGFGFTKKAIPVCTYTCQSTKDIISVLLDH